MAAHLLESPDAKVACFVPIYSEDGESCTEWAILTRPATEAEVAATHGDHSDRYTLCDGCFAESSVTTLLNASVGGLCTPMTWY